ncbi:uncharacterized protein LOC117108986 isoform X2 [Anneissia japonica]|uniref:uncharacterized protein LOC117108986 isoform X2 n=1 Tax=Anneissia japonica TaxID=1529436 RepID=UPI001425A60E|nr:uncharacterized protein LOC117108986 isoform X2 [Anneissia japonica]
MDRLFIIITLSVSIFLTGVTDAICDFNYCLNGGICSDWWGSEFCDCEEEFNGDVCQYEPCAEGPCLNNGDCHADHDSSTALDHHDDTDLTVGIIVAIIIGGIVAVVLLAVCIGCICYHSGHRPPRTTTTVVVPAAYALQPQYPPTS